MQELRANTAVDVLIGPFIDDTDFKTPETGLTISQADVLLSKLGQALAQKNDANAAAHDATGYYNCPLNATDTASEGTLDLKVHESGALPYWRHFMVLSEAAWDSKYAAKDTGYMDVNVKAVSEGTTAADNAEAFFDGTGYAGTNNVIPTVTTLTGHTNQTGDTYVLANGATGFAAIDTVVDAILEDTGTTLPATLATIAGYLDTEIAAILEDTGTTLPATLATLATAASLATAQADLDIITDTSGVVLQDGSITAAKIATNAIDTNKLAADAVDKIADGVWDEPVAGHVAAGSFGKTDADILADTNELQTDDIPATLATLATAVADVPTVAEFEARTIVAASYFDPANDAVATVTDVTNEVSADVTKISGSATAADNLEASALGVVSGACEATPSTTVLQTDLAETTDDHYIGRIVVFTSGNTAGEATDITDYTGATGTLTVTALTTAPAATDTFVIV